LVMNDGAYGAEARELELRGMPIDAALFPHVDFADVARALGARGETIRHTDDVARLEPWIAHPAGPLMVDCRLDPTVTADWFQDAIGSEDGYIRRPVPGF